MIPGGHRLETYRGVPIIPSTGMSPIETMRPTITYTPTTAGSTGLLADGAYYLRIAPITYEGEQLASASQLATVSGGSGTGKITITLSTYHKDANGFANVYAYKIYCTALNGAAGTETLKKVVSAFNYSADGTMSDTPTNGLAGTEISFTTITPGLDVPTAMQNDVPLQATGGVNPENIFLIDVEPLQGLGKMVYTNLSGSLFGGLVTVVDLAKVDAYYQMLISSSCVLTPSFEATSVQARNLRRA
jgi:hypothetical protein